jgi:hypothetical protein
LFEHGSTVEQGPHTRLTGCSHRDWDGYFSAFDAGTLAGSQRVYLVGSEVVYGLRSLQTALRPP